MTLCIGDSTEYLGRFQHDRTPVYFGFSSLGAIVNHVAGLEKPGNIRAASGWDTSMPGWHGSANMPAALTLARDGWQAGTRKAEAIAETLSSEYARKPTRVHSIAGGSVNVGRMLAGNPAHMRRRVSIQGRKVITLFVENSVSAGVDREIIIKRAAMIGATADILENAGYSCEIVTLLTYTTDDVDGEKLACQTAITLKSAGERLNLNDVIFGLGHPSLQRRLNFALVGTTSHLQGIWSNFGYPAAAFSKTHQPGKNEYYFPMIQIRDLKKVDTNNIHEFFRFLLPKELRITLDDQRE